MTTRREFLTRLSLASGAVVLMPAVSLVARAQESQPTSAASGLPAVPYTRPSTWDPIVYNRVRGNAGAIPESYLPAVNGPDGVAVHLGKHLPYVPDVDASLVPERFIAIMWGDPALGYTRHPNAERNESNNNEGHWYNWIRVRKAVEGDAEESESRYTDWPGIGADSTGAYAVFGGGELTDDAGKNTIYLAALPADVSAGDTVRIYAHCLTHGEYVDFLTV